MILDSYINSVIDKHELQYEIEIDDVFRKQIKSSILKNCFAFQIIYKPTLGNHRYMMVTKIIKNLDIDKVKSKDIYEGVEFINTIYSYDGTDNFKYAERETILFDKSTIRNLKLNHIIKDEVDNRC